MCSGDVVLPYWLHPPPTCSARERIIDYILQMHLTDVPDVQSADPITNSVHVGLTTSRAWADFFPCYLC